jgi:hypothetical protein
MHGAGLHAKMGHWYRQPEIPTSVHERFDTLATGLAMTSPYRPEDTIHSSTMPILSRHGLKSSKMIYAGGVERSDQTCPAMPPKVQ